MRLTFLYAFIFSLLLVALSDNSAMAQIQTPAKWKSYHKPNADIAVGSIVTLYFEATIDKDWYLYSSDFDPDLGPMVTTFAFEESDSYQRIGNIEPQNPKKKYDDLWGGEYTYFVGTGVFTQKIKILKPNPIVKAQANVDYQVCTDKTGQCIPLEEDFSFEIKTKPSAADETTHEEQPTEKQPTPDTEDENQPTNEDIVSDSQEDTTNQASDLQNATDDSQSNTQTNQNAASKTENDLSTAPDKGFIWLFITAFLAGIAALLTPCVFPMIPMTVSYFTKNSRKEPETIKQPDGSVIERRMSKSSIDPEALKNGLIYGFSIIAFYTLIGVIVSAIFGATVANVLATHWLPNMIFFLVFLIFAISFFGAFDIVLPSSFVNAIDRKADQGGYTGIFFMAIALVLVSFSCTGPLAGTILVEAADGHFARPIVGMLGFSLAFALPFTFFAIFPAWLSNLPKSGGWLNSVKVVLGFIELALALKFLSIVDQVYHWDILNRDIYLALWIAIFGMMGFYLLGKIRLPHDSPIEKLGVGRMLLALVTFSFVIYLIPGLFGAPLAPLAGYLPPRSGMPFDLTQNQNVLVSQVDERLKPVPERRFSDKFSKKMPLNLSGFFDYNEALEASRITQKPIMIDFTGHGCVNCREMEERVWTDKSVLERLQNDYIILALYVDDPTTLPRGEWITSEYDGKIKKTIGKINADFQINRFQRNSQPFYVLMNEKGELLRAEDGSELTKGYELDVAEFVKFLDKGKIAFKAKN
ncbi:MAG: thioredoxin family protein [Bernardetiaceae bacterium]|nr:thioredoxin family protein [Bernardetiaceae bacterium]